jgi:choline-sulfatase
MANVVILMSDEHNPFISSLYGHPMVRTPNMERLAKLGTVFKNAYCPSPVCLASRSAFMAGRRVHEIGTYNNCNMELNADYPSYGKALAEQGVHSVHIGKTDVYAQSAGLGFSEMIGAKDRKLPGDTNFMRRPLSVRNGAASRANGFGVRADAFDNDLKVMDTAIEWLTDKAPELDCPWTLTVNILNPHFPQWNTQEYWDKYPEGGDLPLHGPDSLSANHPYAQDLRKHFETDLFTEEQIRGLRRGYLGNVSFVDDQIGRLLNLLEQTGQLADTNFIYTSDHGDMLGKFGMWWKCSLYEDSVRIPCLAAGPDFTAGLSIDTPVDLHDVQASVFASVGAERPEQWTGKPLQHIAPDDRERVVFSEYHGHGLRSGAYMIRKGEWKLIHNMEAPHQLFHLAGDPDELDNLYSSNTPKAEELEQELRRICSPEEENDKAHQFQDLQVESLIKHGYALGLEA